MRIALLTYSTKPRGGVVHTLELAEALVAAGASVDVWSLARGGDAGFFRPVDDRIGLRLVPFGDLADESVGQRILRSISQFAAIFDPSGYDVVHAQDCITANAVGRCIRTVHHLDTFTTPELISCHERALRVPYAHICVSAAVAAEVKQGWGITAQVIGNGIDYPRFADAASSTPVSVEGRRSWSQRLGPYVLTVGGIEPRKGTDDLIEAMALVQAVRPELTLVVGGGETLFDYRSYRASVLERAEQLGLRLQVLGPVEHPRLPALMAQAAVFAFPSRKEGFGLAAMEALATGTPVVMRDLPVLREVFGPAVTYASTPTELAKNIIQAAARENHAAARENHAAARDPWTSEIETSQPDPEIGRALAARCRWADVAQAHLAFYRKTAR